LNTWNCAGNSIPVELAGDTLNIIPLDDHKIAFCVIDVRGHGVASALLSVALNRWLSSLPGIYCVFPNNGLDPMHFDIASPAAVARRPNQQFPMTSEIPRHGLPPLWNPVTAITRISQVLPDGSLVKGMEVFRRAYDAVGLGWLLAPTNWPVLRSISDAGYAWFARIRLHLTGRTSACY